MTPLLGRQATSIRINSMRLCVFEAVFEEENLEGCSH
jgi:hypothetical protein